MNIAVIFAGGVGSRMKTKEGIPKQFLTICDKPVLAYTLGIFQKNENIDKIIVVMLDGYIEKTRDIVEKYGFTKVDKIVLGGTTSQESIYNGLAAACDYGDDNAIVLIHDGVRPFIDDELINDNIKSVKNYRTAISCAPSKETIIKIRDDKYVENVVDRSAVWLARAPQSFYLKDIMLAHEKAKQQGDSAVIDSCTMMKKYSDIDLHIVETKAENIKITTPEDYYVAQGLIMKYKEDDE